MCSAHTVNYIAFVHCCLSSCLKSSPDKVHEAQKQPSRFGCSHFVEDTENNLVCLKNLLLFPRVSPDVGEQELDYRTGNAQQKSNMKASLAIKRNSEHCSWSVSLIKIPSAVHPSSNSCRHVISPLSVLLNNLSFCFFWLCIFCIKECLRLSILFVSANAKSVHARESNPCVTLPYVSTEWHAQEVTAGMNCSSVHCFTLVYGQCCQHVAVMFTEHHWVKYPSWKF